MLNDKTCPICGKKVHQLEIVSDSYGIPYKMYCGSPKCKKEAKKDLRPNYRSDGY